MKPFPVVMKEATHPKRVGFLLVRTACSQQSSMLQAHIILHLLHLSLCVYSVCVLFIVVRSDIKVLNTFASSDKARIEVYIKFFSLWKVSVLIL